MKKILLVQFRVTGESALHEKNCILRNVREKKKVKSVNVFKENFDFSSDNLSQFGKIILGGSGEFSISEKKEKPELWEKVKKVVPVLKQNIPILGICFGHQLIAYVLGSEVIADAAQKEVGTYKVSLTENGKKDKLFRGIPEKLLVQEGHKDSVKDLPPGAELLAVGEKCKIQAFRFQNIHAVQFHPELEAEDMRFRLKLFPDYNNDNSEINLEPSPFASKVLENFIQE